MKAFSESCRKQSGRLASSFSLRRSARPLRDERTSAVKRDILTPDFKPHSRLPAGVYSTSSGSWELVIRYSGATVADSHGVPSMCLQLLADLSPADFKEQKGCTTPGNSCQDKSPIREGLLNYFLAGAAGRIAFSSNRSVAIWRLTSAEVLLVRCKCNERSLQTRAAAKSPVSR